MLSLNWQQARKHQSNNSHSKSTFAFGKDSRFKYNKTSLCDSFYNLPSYLGRAPSSGIGRGSKTQLLNPSVHNPSPQSYHVQTGMDQNKKGIIFGLGRQKIKCHGIFNKSETPEPGHYQSKSQFQTKKGFTIYSRIDLPTFSNAKNPGPAHYSSKDALNRSGRYVLSQLSNCPGYKIKPSKKLEICNTNPGPGQYCQGTENMNATGRYWNSRHENSRCRTFSKSAKNVQSKEKIPGPGSYNYYSQFGSKN